MKKVGLFVSILGVIILGACEQKEQTKETIKICSATDEMGRIRVEVYDVEDKITRFTVASTILYSESLSKEEAEMIVDESDNHVPQGVLMDGEINDDSYTITMEIEIAKIMDEDLNDLEGSLPVKNIKNSTVEEFVKSWEGRGFTCE